MRDAPHPGARGQGEAGGGGGAPGRAATCAVASGSDSGNAGSSERCALQKAMEEDEEAEEDEAQDGQQSLYVKVMSCLQTKDMLSRLLHRLDKVFEMSLDYSQIFVN